MIVGQQLSKIIESGRLRWSATIGRMHYRNAIVVSGNIAVASTAGSIWNEDDSKDGVYALDLASGKSVWHARTLGDANGITLIGTMLVGGTDRGQIFAIDSVTGELRAAHATTSPIFAKPIVVQSGTQEVAVLISYAGDIVIFDPAKAEFQLAGRMRGDFRADPATNAKLSAAGQFVVASEAGEVVRLVLQGSSAMPYFLHQLESRRSSTGNYRLSVRGVGSLLVEGDDLIVSYLRDTYDKHPPIVCLDLATGGEKWHARAVKTLSRKRSDYGNVRVRPVVRNGMLYSTFGYNDSLHAFSLSTGRGEWMVQLDEGLFQNWASPIEGPETRLFVPRVNGVVHEVDVKKRKVVNTISVEIGRYISNDDYYIRKRHFGEDLWEDTSPITSESKLDSEGPGPDEILDAGIAATPLYADGLLLVGSVSGILRAYNI